MPPPKKSNDMTGDSNTQPRSLARVFRAIRHHQKPKMNGATMHAHLASQESRYRMPVDSNGSMSTRKNGGTPRHETYKWEDATGQPSFAVLHRYALASRTFTGVLHLTSLFYAHFREAGLAKTEASERAHLEFIEAVADGLMAFALSAKGNAAAFKTIKKTYNFSKNKHHDSDELRDQFIALLLDGFRDSPAIKSHDMSVERGRTAPPNTHAAPAKRKPRRKN